MSIAGHRQEIVDALNGAGLLISATTFRPRVIGALTAWPIVGELTRTSEVPDMLVQWRIMIVLPVDEAAAVQWFDEHHETVDEALSDVGWVTSIAATAMKTDSGDFPVMVVTLNREAV
jgi:hypothetical protein